MAGAARVSIYGDNYQTYWDRGWRGIIPLPPKQKKPPPTGYTGQGGIDPSYPDCHTWAEPTASYTVTGREGGTSHITVGNIALRLPPNVIGIDVDDYGDKDGGRTLTQREHEWGTLPDTWRSTSRDDGVSGIRLFRAPEGLAWPNQAGHSIEMIHHGHRYLVAAPSIHPDTGKPYRWINRDGITTVDIPHIDDLPLLPAAWIEGLTGGELAEHVTRGSKKIDEAMAWLAQQPHAIATPCRTMGAAADTAASDLTGGAHDACTAGVLRLVRYADTGHHGVIDAISTIKRAFTVEVTNPRRRVVGKTSRTEPEAAREFQDILVSAINLVSANPSGETTCDCFGQITNTITGDTNPTERMIESDTSSAPMLHPGGDFILDVPDTPPSVWGGDDTIMWAQGEAFMIVGTPGAGKTTLTGQILRGLVGLEHGLLDMPIRTHQRVLYLAMDRPDQIRRALRRIFTNDDRDTLNERLVFWKGPPPQDMAKNPDVLLALARLAEAQVVIIDSLKDGAIGLSEDEVGAGYNRCRQTALAHGVEILELHHQVKRNASGGKPKGLEDVYGSTWLTAGAGSVLLLHAEEAGSEIVTALHLKQPMSPFGPAELEHDHTTGRTTWLDGERRDPEWVAATAGREGVTWQQVRDTLGGEWSRGKDEACRKRITRRLDEAVLRGSIAITQDGGGRYEKRWGPVTSWVPSQAESEPDNEPDNGPDTLSDRPGHDAPAYAQMSRT